MPASAQSLFSTHRTLSVFLLKMAAIYAVWFVVYDLWLLPDGRLDAWLSTSVASWTGAVLRPFYDTVVVDGRTVWATPTAGVIIENGCNGLSALSLFVGFIVAYPGTWARRALFVPLGLVAIVVTNIVRCASLLVISDRWPSIFGEVHGLHALFVFYLVIFGLWVLWANYGGADDARPAPPAAPPTGTPALAGA
jgi:exosortase/archaeosortase family protein